MRPPVPPATVPAEAEDVVNNNRVRGALQAARAALQLLLARHRRAPGRHGRAAQAVARGSAAAAARKGLRGRDRCRPEGRARPHARHHPGVLARQGQAAGGGGGAGRQRPVDRGQPAAGAPGARCRDRPRGARRARHARSTACAPSLAWGERLGVVFTGISARLDPAAGRARPGHHLRPDGRHQHGARRADDDRRLRDLRGAERLQRHLPGLFDYYILAAIPAGVPRLRRWSAQRWSAA